MATNQYVNKVVYGGTTLIDLTADTVTSSALLSGVTAHDKAGAPVTGSCDWDSNTTDANATASELLLNKTAYVNKVKITGQMPNNGATGITVSSLGGTTIPIGFYDGSGKAVIDSTSAANVTANNIRRGITILGVVGTLSPEDQLVVGAAVATPYTTSYTITAASLDYDYITQVTVASIAYTESDNPQGGKTVTIGTVAPA